MRGCNQVALRRARGETHAISTVIFYQGDYRVATYWLMLAATDRLIDGMSLSYRIYRIVLLLVDI